MYKIIFLIALIAYQVKCESEIVTTILPLEYSANQVDDDSNSNIDRIESRNPSIVNNVESFEKQNFVNSPSVIDSVDEIQSNEVKVSESSNAVPVKTQESNQVYIDIATNSPRLPVEDITTIQPELQIVRRIKRAPRYTVRQLLAPNGVGHEIGHLRDHAVERVARVAARSSPLNSAASRIARTYKARTQVHHRYHHIPNHLAYLPVVGPLLDERRPLRGLRSSGRSLRFAGFRRGSSRRSLFRRLRRVL